MPAEFDFSWARFLRLVLVVAVPTLTGAGVIWVVGLSEQARASRSPDSDGPLGTRTGRGPLGLWATGLLAFALGFLSCASWLTWSADHHGAFRGPALPAPKEFPTWQVLACGATVVLACLVAAHLSRWTLSGGLAAAAGTAAGFTTAFSVDAAADSTGLAGVGVTLSEIGWGLGLALVMLARSARRTGRH